MSPLALFFTLIVVYGITVLTLLAGFNLIKRSYNKQRNDKEFP